MLHHPWGLPDENTGVGCHALCQGIFPTQGLNPHLLHWQVDSLALVISTTWETRVCVCVCVCVYACTQETLLSYVQLFVTLWAVAHNWWVMGRAPFTQPCEHRPNRLPLTTLSHFHNSLWQILPWDFLGKNTGAVIAYGEWCQIHGLWRRFSFRTRDQAWWSLKSFCVAEVYKSEKGKEKVWHRHQKGDEECPPR